MMQNALSSVAVMHIYIGCNGDSNGTEMEGNQTLI